MTGTHSTRSNVAPVHIFNNLQIGFPGGGGEYDVQEGFGWSNGVLLHFLSKYPKIRFEDRGDTGSGLSINSPSWLYKMFFGILAARLLS